MSITLEKLISDYERFDQYLIQFGEDPKKYEEIGDKFIKLAKLAADRNMLPSNESEMVKSDSFDRIVHQSSSVEEMLQEYDEEKKLLNDKMIVEPTILSKLHGHFTREKSISAGISMALARAKAIKANGYSAENMDKIYSFLEGCSRMAAENEKEIENFENGV